MERTAQSMGVLLFAVVILFSPAFNSSGQAGADGKLIEAAKSEGLVSYYTTMTLSQSKKVADRFQAKYPFLKVNLFRGGADELLNRIETEARGRLFAWDLVSGRGDMVLTLSQAKLLAAYHSPECRFIDHDMVDDEG
jgi:iron(III) transport system substrate-binding protein